MTTVHHQTFAVPYAFDVHFTRDVFAPDNDSLVKAMKPAKGGRPAPSYTSTKALFAKAPN